MTHSDLTDLLDRQLQQHGYHLTPAELKDIAAQILMCLEPAPALRHQIDQLQANFAAWVEGLKQWRPSDSDNNQPIEGTK
jgi:transposase InsO family protein